MQWQKKIYQHEEPPPPEVWDAIARDLSDEPVALRTALFLHEEDPPQAVWNKIQNELREGETPPNSRPVEHRWFGGTVRWIRSHAAAAAVIGFFLTAGIYFLASQDMQLIPQKLASGIRYADSPMQKEVPTISDSPSVIAKIDITPPASEPSEKEMTADLTENRLGSIAKTTPGSDRKRQPGRTNGLAKTAINGFENIQHTVSYNDGNYIRVKDPQGHEYRLNYKLTAFAEALRLNQQSRESQLWESQVNAWAKKMEEVQIVPSPGNFYELNELIRLFNEQ